MNSDLQNLIDLQEVDLQAAALKAEVAALPKHVAEIEAKLAGSQKKVQIAQAGMKADEASRRRYESEIQDQQQKIRKYRDQSLNVKTNPEYRALLNEIERRRYDVFSRRVRVSRARKAMIFAGAWPARWGLA